MSRRQTITSLSYPVGLCIIMDLTVRSIVVLLKPSRVVSKTESVLPRRSSSPALTSTPWQQSQSQRPSSTVSAACIGSCRISKHHLASQKPNHIRSMGDIPGKIYGNRHGGEWASHNPFLPVGTVVIRVTYRYHDSPFPPYLIVSLPSLSCLYRPLHSSHHPRGDVSLLLVVGWEDGGIVDGRLVGWFGLGNGLKI